MGQGGFGVCVYQSNGVQVGSLLLPSLVSCELPCDRVVCPRCSLPSAHWAKAYGFCLTVSSYLWMQTGGNLRGTEAIVLFLAFLSSHFFDFRCFAAPFHLFAGL